MPRELEGRQFEHNMNLSDTNSDGRIGTSSGHLILQSCVDATLESQLELVLIFPLTIVSKGFTLR